MTDARPWLILGAHGQMARAFAACLPEALCRGRESLDLARPERLPAQLDLLRPGVVLNAAAYTQVDAAETQEAEATRINGEAPCVLARWCAANDAALVHLSSDYVLDGSGARPWREDDASAPLNAYGRSKRLGEKNVLNAGGRALIFRTSWVYDAGGRNFFTTILRLAAQERVMHVVADQWGAPTYAPHLAQAIVQALRQALTQASFPTGLYHLCHQGEVSWHGFAETIVAGARARGMRVLAERIDATMSDAAARAAPRPRNSRLDCARARSMLGVALPFWQQGLEDAFQERCDDKRLPD